MVLNMRLKNHKFSLHETVENLSSKNDRIPVHLLDGGVSTAERNSGLAQSVIVRTKDNKCRKMAR